MSAGVLRGLQNRSGVFGRWVGSIPTHSRQILLALWTQESRSNLNSRDIDQHPGVKYLYSKANQTVL